MILLGEVIQLMPSDFRRSGTSAQMPARAEREHEAGRWACSGLAAHVRLGRLPATLAAQTVRHLPAEQETWVRYPSQKDPLEKGMATHSSILAWRIPWTEEPGGLQSMGVQRVHATG